MVTAVNDRMLKITWLPQNDHSLIVKDEKGTLTATLSVIKTLGTNVISVVLPQGTTLEDIRRCWEQKQNDDWVIISTDKIGSDPFEAKLALFKTGINGVKDFCLEWNVHHNNMATYDSLVITNLPRTLITRTRKKTELKDD